MKKEVGTYVCQQGRTYIIKLPPKQIGYLNVPYISQHISGFSEIS